MVEVTKIGTRFYNINMERRNDKSCFVTLSDNGGGSILIDEKCQVEELRLLIEELSSRWEENLL